jgi:hypothetical protein
MEDEGAVEEVIVIGIWWISTLIKFWEAIFEHLPTQGLVFRNAHDYWINQRRGIYISKSIYNLQSIMLSTSCFRDLRFQQGVQPD